MNPTSTSVRIVLHTDISLTGTDKEVLDALRTRDMRHGIFGIGHHFFVGRGGGYQPTRQAKRPSPHDNHARDVISVFVVVPHYGSINPAQIVALLDLLADVSGLHDVVKFDSLIPGLPNDLLRSFLGLHAAYVV